MLTTGKTYDFEGEILSPMGWVKILAAITVTGDTAFSGTARLLGFTVELTDCVRGGDHVRFAAAPKLPFGVLRVELEADVAQDGAVTGVANAPRHRPMALRGRMTAA